MRLRTILSVVLLVFMHVMNAVAAEQVYFYHTDPVGTALAMTNSSGTVVWQEDYRPFGEQQSVSGTVANTKEFVGKEKDAETGLSYFGARFEDAKTGRFVSVDPVRVVDERTSKTNEKILLNPQRLNAYAYGLNNPYSFVDPDGKDVRYKDASIALLGIGSNSFGLVIGFGLGATPEPTMLSKAVAVAVTIKSSYGVTVNYNNFRNAINGQAPTSTGGLGTDLAQVIAPSDKRVKALGTISELSLDILTGVAGRSASSSLGVLNKYDVQRTFIKNPTELGRYATGVQLGDLTKTGIETHNDLK